MKKFLLASIIFFSPLLLIESSANCDIQHTIIHHQRCCDPSQCSGLRERVFTQVQLHYECLVYDSTTGICLLKVYIGCTIIIIDLVWCDKLCWDTTPPIYNEPDFGLLNELHHDIIHRKKFGAYLSTSWVTKQMVINKPKDFFHTINLFLSHHYIKVPD